MPRARTADVPDLLSLLAGGDPVPAAALAQALGVSRPILARLVAEAGPAVLRIGKARATAYAARARTDAGEAWPLWRMRPDATLEELGTLHALRGDRFFFEASGDRPLLTRSVDRVAGFHPGLPWFLDDLRPQGFLGRTLAHRQGRALGVPDDLNRWQVRDTLLAITRTGGTGIGDLILGQEALTTAMAERDTPTDAVAASDRARQYPAWAQAALAGEDIGSSPGGEQPKFTATVHQEDGARYAALVKFAVPDEGHAVRRWADLLGCEHLAATTLHEAGLPAALSQCLHADGYTFLEVRRFDRAADTLGRRGFVSLQALDAAFYGDGARDWGRFGERLAADGWITTQDATQMARLHWFGRFIDNSDMHAGNLGFHLGNDRPLALAPAYDMLPMALAPSRTGAVRPVEAVRPTPPDRTGQIEHIRWAAGAAIAFWHRVADSELIGSDDMRALARANIDAVGNFARQFA